MKVLLTLLLCLPVMAQPRLSVSSSPHVQLKLEAYEPGGAFEALFNSQTAQYRELHLIATNQSSRDIVALVAVWRYAAAGVSKPRTQTLETDSYQTVSLVPVISRGARVLISPGGVIPESLIGKPAIGGTINPRALEALASASQVSFGVDLVVFSDGEAAGPDSQHTVSELTARYHAAQKVATAWRAGGQDALAALISGALPVVPLMPTIEQLQEANWIRTFSSSINKFPDARARAFVDHLASNPKPLEMHRGGTAQ